MIPLGPFELQAPIGTGGMGQVWSGVHRASSTPVAVKVLTGGMARAPRYLECFRNEVRAAAGLDHPSIVVLYDHGEIPPATESRSEGVLVAGSPYLVMERLPGGTLSELRGRLAWPILRGALLDLLWALAHAHARGVIHRDIKPSNALVVQGGDGLAVKLGDFGLAHPFERERLDGEELQVVGTPAFMAPEQLLSRWHDYGPWTDLFAFGCLAYTLVAGHPPWANVKDSVAPQLYRPAPPLEPLMPVPEGFGGWLARLLHREPAQRFVRAPDAAWALGHLPEPAAVPWTTRVSPKAPAEPGTGERLSSDEPTSAATRPVTSPRHEPPQGGLETGTLPAPGTVVAPPVPESWRGEHPERPSFPLAGAGLGLFGLRRVPLVGRDAERTVLWDRLREAIGQRKPGVVVLQGPAGCGKTRLAEWLAERALEVGAATVLRATHSPEGSPVDGVPAMICRLLRCRDMSRTGVVERARAVLVSLGVEDPVEALALAELVSPAVGTGTIGGTVRFRGPTERHELVRRLLERVAAERAVVVWLDDVQWGADALELVAHVLATAGGRPLPVLFVLTCRTQDAVASMRESRLLQELEASPDARVVEVGPLPTEQRLTLVRELLGLEGSLAEEVEARMQGNPLFAVQLVGEWVHAGLLEPGPSGFRLRDGARAEVPRDALTLWSSRIERLLEGRRIEDVVALELAALLGTEVDAAEWREVCRRAMLPAPTELVEALLERALARTGPEGPGAGWSFAHDLLRDSVERRARAAGRWASHHAVCAEMLRRRSGPGIAERLGRHLVAANQPREAVGPLLAGARERLVQGDLAVAWARVSETEAAIEDAGLAAGDERRGDVMVLREEIAERRGDLEEATRWAQRAVQAGVQRQWPRVRAQGLGALGRIARQHGQLARAWLQLRRAERIARAADERKVLADSRRHMGRLLGDRGELDLAAACYRLGLEDYEAVGDEEGAAFCAWGLGTLARKAGRLDDTVEHLQDARDRFERCGSRWGVALCVNLLGEVARFRGQRTEAELHYREALAGFRAVGSQGDASVVEFNLCLLLVQTGRRDEARKTLEGALRQALHAGRHALAVSVLAALLPCDAGARDWSAWDVHVRELEVLRERIAIVDVDIAGAAELGAELAAEAGERERAQVAWEIALAQWTGLGRRAEADAVRARLVGAGIP